MRKWSKDSLAVYETLDARLQYLMDEVLHEVADISLIGGHRDRETQNRYNDEGVSQVRWPNSKHNHYPSLAVDFQPFPYPTDERVLWAALGYIAGQAKLRAERAGFTVRWGGDWDQDGDLTDTNFYDLFHLEIV